MASRSPFEVLMRAFRSMKGQAPAAAAPTEVSEEGAPGDQNDRKRKPDRKRLPWQLWHLVEHDASPAGAFGHLRPGVDVPPPTGTFAHLRPGADVPPPEPSKFSHLVARPDRWPR